MKSFVCGGVFPGCTANWICPAGPELQVAVRSEHGSVHHPVSVEEPGADTEGGVEWPGLLERAIQGEGLRFVYQPIVDLGRFEIAGYEALVRFDLGPRFGPDAWFAAAKRWGVAAELEATTLRRALSIRDDIPQGVFMTVNVEPESLCSSQVLDVFSQLGSLKGIAIEITAHRPVDDPGAVASAFERFRAAGALISMDQPGSGYAVLPQLLAIRPDILKLDRALTEDIDSDDAKASLVQLAAAFASQIGSKLLAGIETIEEGRRCAALGVELAQGFIVGRPAEPWPVLKPELRRQIRPSVFQRLVTSAR